MKLQRALLNLTLLLGISIAQHQQYKVRGYFYYINNGYFFAPNVNNSKNVANLEAFFWVISGGINLFFLKSV